MPLFKIGGVVGLPEEEVVRVLREAEEGVCRLVALAGEDVEPEVDWPGQLPGD